MQICKGTEKGSDKWASGQLQIIGSKLKGMIKETLQE